MTAAAKTTNSFITADIPDNQVLFDLWGCVLNHRYADSLKHKNKLDEEAAIINSWVNIFDLDRRGHGIWHRRNRKIQTTFWELRAEWIVDSARIKGFQRWKQEQVEKWGGGK